MVCKITDDVINALQHCRLKAYFRLHGEAGAQCGYEKLLIEQRTNVQRRVIAKIRREYSETEMAADINLSVANLRKGVPFKRISDYRDDVRRSIKEAGLTEHLVLLSIYQTCRVRDISFLKFLLSRERDIDAFAAGKRRRKRAPRIELYPKGYLPPSIGSLRRGQAARASDTITAEAE